ncbi:MAG: amino acid synthesis family protein, partial [Acidimicrobiales bacterium]|nr:amino acid synthesis family protein [Acidimicrobiales bacterium]MYB80325.1 amino acid synthesis family protein [Acidimicrobiales bacterium]MYI09490.1 amino acid synthesis family protein [Acidimicrobiales bacterium]MYI11959.1 amino acid synthesis family protein [Acidimicrobiales bacterium]
PERPSDPQSATTNRTASQDLSPYYEASVELGEEIAALAVDQMQPYTVMSYGKAAIVGLDGEQEHGVALLTTPYGNVLREAAGGGSAWISSATKRAQPGASIDIPLAYKDALYVRSHYDAMSITLHDVPLPDEIAVICCFANRGRPHHRVGGLSIDDAVGEDGLT